MRQTSAMLTLQG